MATAAKPPVYPHPGVEHGRLALALFGGVLVVAGLLIALLSVAAIGLFAAVLGVVIVVLAVYDWNEFTAEVSAVKFKIGRGAMPITELRSPELDILSIERAAIQRPCGIRARICTRSHSRRECGGRGFARRATTSQNRS